MSKYEDMAKKALDEQLKAKALREEEAAQRRARDEERRRLELTMLEENVAPTLNEAIKGFRKAKIEARPLAVASRPIPSFGVRPYVGMEVGHNKVGRTGDRIATLVAWTDGQQIHIAVDSGNGPESSWQTEATDASATLEQAVEDSLNRWLERGYPRRR